MPLINNLASFGTSQCFTLVVALGRHSFRKRTSSAQHDLFFDTGHGDQVRRKHKERKTDTQALKIFSPSHSDNFF